MSKFAIFDALRKAAKEKEDETRAARAKQEAELAELSRVFAPVANLWDAVRDLALTDSPHTVGYAMEEKPWSKTRDVFNLELGIAGKTVTVTVMQDPIPTPGKFTATLMTQGMFGDLMRPTSFDEISAFLVATLTEAGVRVPPKPKFKEGDRVATIPSLSYANSVEGVVISILLSSESVKYGVRIEGAHTVQPEEALRPLSDNFKEGDYVSAASEDDSTPDIRGEIVSIRKDTDGSLLFGVKDYDDNVFEYREHELTAEDSPEDLEAAEVQRLKDEKNGTYPDRVDPAN